MAHFTFKEPSEMEAGDSLAPAALPAKLLRWGVATLLICGCTPTTSLSKAGDGDEHFGGLGRVAATQGSAVAVTADERIAVATNRTSGIVSILRLDPSRPSAELVLDGPITEIPFHPLNTTRPWAAVIGADDDTAYVLVRGVADDADDAEVVEIAALHSGKPHLTGRRATVGSEPTSIVISPSGKRIYVANSADGTISVIVTQDLNSVPLSLNGRLANSGLLGPAVRDRPGLAHPRALAITDDGDQDDADETLYATEFYSQPIADTAVSDPDRNRQGIVYPIDAGGHAPLDAAGREIPLISLSAIDTGFNDAEDKPTGCFPNQLYGAAAQDNRLYVTSVCASPAGPVESGAKVFADLAGNNFKTLVHPVVFTIDTANNREIGEPVVLSRQLADANRAGEPDQRMPLIPNEIVLAREGGDSGAQAYVTSFGAAAVFSIRYDGQGNGTVESGAQHYVKLYDSSLPIGMATLSGKRALLLDDTGGKLGVIALATHTVASWTSTIRQDWEHDSATKASEVVGDDVRRGRRLFATGLGAWSLGGQSWSSCESCHPEGLSDGVTWRFARGPRRTISLAGTYVGDGADVQRRMLLWTANIDEVHDVEGIARNLSGGTGGVVWNPYAADHPHQNCRLIYDGGDIVSAADETFCKTPRATTDRLNGLNGSLSDITRAGPGDECDPTQGPCDVNASNDWDQIDAFVRTVRAPRAPRGLDPNIVADGKQLFQARGCDRCHSGLGWTLSRVFYEPSLAINGAIPSTAPTLGSAEAEPATLLGALRTQTFQLPPSAPAEFKATVPSASMGPVPFRNAPSDTTPQSVLDYVYAKPPPPDQVTCVLRSVGTFGKPAAPNFLGIAPAGAPAVREVRRVLEADVYTDKVATGGTGFNIPSLLGLASGAPYFHAGNARTLEELFDQVFKEHYAALGGAAPTADEVQALVDYLLSIDEDLAPLPTPTDGYDPDLCAQFVAPGK